MDEEPVDECEDDFEKASDADGADDFEQASDAEGADDFEQASDAEGAEIEADMTEPQEEAVEPATTAMVEEVDSQAATGAEIEKADMTQPQEEVVETATTAAVPAATKAPAAIKVISSIYSSSGKADPAEAVAAYQKLRRSYDKPKLGFVQLQNQNPKSPRGPRRPVQPVATEPATKSNSSISKESPSYAKVREEVRSWEPWNVQSAYLDSLHKFNPYVPGSEGIYLHKGRALNTKYLPQGPVDSAAVDALKKKYAKHYHAVGKSSTSSNSPRSKMQMAIHKPSPLSMIWPVLDAPST